MAETSRLLATHSSRNGALATITDYGSVAYERVEPSSCDHRPVGRRPEFVYRKKDCVVVSVMAVIVVVAICTSLLFGIPSIRRKADRKAIVTPSQVTGDGAATVGDGFRNGGSSLLTSSSTAWLTSTATSSADGTYASAAVTSNCPACSTIGLDVLRRNGSAVDAAIAATFCLSVCDAHHTGLGGGLVMTVYNRKTRKAEVIDARETAPQLANCTMFDSRLSSSMGGLSVAVPGLVKGLWMAHRRYGKLGWSTLVGPSVDLAEKGTVVGRSLADALELLSAWIIREPTLRSLLVDPSTNSPFKKGDVLRQPLLGQTLRTLALEGGDALYTGELARRLVADIRNLGGVITLDDLRNYTVLFKEPVTVDYADPEVRFHSAPGPASGHLVAFFLNVMEGYNLTGRRTATGPLEDDVRTVQLVTEALKHVYAKRTLLGDPNYVDQSELTSNLTSKEFATAVRQSISENTTFPPDYYGANVYQHDYGTSHVSVVSADGDAVAVTSTINQLFGALVASTSTGIILNNEMDDFSSPNVTNGFQVPPSRHNFIEPGKRPVSSMCPTVIADARGDAVLVTGAAGGTRITSSTALMVLRHLWMGEDLKAATDAPRLHHQLFPNILEVESRFPRAVIRRLTDIGHRVVFTAKMASAVNSIGRRSDGGGNKLHAVADGRVVGGQAGY